MYKSEQERHGLVKGRWVTVVTQPNGVRNLYLYETGASWYTGIGDKVTTEQWDGEEMVSLYNGD